MREQGRRQKVCLTIAILWALFIWSNSLQAADVSAASSSGIVELLAPLLRLFHLSEEVQHTVVRKAAHMVEFAVSGTLWILALLFRAKNSPRSRWICRGFALLICLATAAVDESIQYFVPGRSCELRDVCIDLLGGLLGLLVASAAMAFWNNRKLHRKV